jgi:hypothetical protein
MNPVEDAIPSSYVFQSPFINVWDHKHALYADFLFIVMQAGLAFLEAGAARLKNTTDIILKKMIILCKYTSTTIPSWAKPVVVLLI